MARTRKTTVTFPTFPLPRGWYFGPRNGPRASVSGLFGHGRELAMWQAQMQGRGWRIETTGVYDAQTEIVARAFQEEKKLEVDGKIGESTWVGAWVLEITP